MFPPVELLRQQHNILPTSITLADRQGMGERYKTGFVLEEPNIQVFEKKPKAPVAEDQK